MVTLILIHSPNPPDSIFAHTSVASAIFNRCLRVFFGSKGVCVWKIRSSSEKAAEEINPRFIVLFYFCGHRGCLWPWPNNSQTKIHIDLREALHYPPLGAWRVYSPFAHFLWHNAPQHEGGEGPICVTVLQAHSRRTKNICAWNSECQRNSFVQPSAMLLLLSHPSHCGHEEQEGLLNEQPCWIMPKVHPLPHSISISCHSSPPWMKTGIQSLHHYYGAKSYYPSHNTRSRRPYLAQEPHSFMEILPRVTCQW